MEIWLVIGGLVLAHVFVLGLMAGDSIKESLKVTLGSIPMGLLLLLVGIAFSVAIAWPLGALLCGGDPPFWSGCR